MKFYLEGEAEKKFMIWLQEHNKTCSDIDTGVIGGRVTFQFTPTSLSVITQVKCACGKKINLTDYKGW
jgi:hypothetical protein